MFFDPLYIIITLPVFIFMIYAQVKVSSTYNKYSRVPNQRGLTGAQAAQVLLKANGLSDVRIEGIKHKLGDHYDPTKKVLRLSPGVGDTASISALGIAAHEVGHAVQHKTKYAFMCLRSALVPAANIGSTFGWILVFIGFLLMAFSAAFGSVMVLAGILLFSAAVLFTLVTLPVEFNASNRARQMLRDNGLLVAQEYDGASAVLSAAALTYVAAMLQAVAQLFYFVLIFLGGRRD